MHTVVQNPIAGLETAVALEPRRSAQAPQGGNATAKIPFYDRLAWSVREFASGAGVSVAYIYLEIGRGRLRLTKRGRRSLILRDDGLSWLKA